MVKNTVLWGTHYFLSDENKKIFTEITKKRGDMFLIVARPLCLGGVSSCTLGNLTLDTGGFLSLIEKAFTNRLDECRQGRNLLE